MLAGDSWSRHQISSITELRPPTIIGVSENYSAARTNDIDPERDASYFTRASARALRGDIHLEDLRQFDAAVVEYSQAIDLDPDNASYFEKRGTAYQELGYADRAAADFGKAVRLAGTE